MISHVAIIGAGTMGQGIAQLCATSGYAVVLFDAKEGLAETALGNIRKTIFRLVEKGKLDSSAAESTLANISTVKDIAALRADLIVEAVVEDLAVKQKIFRQVEEVNSERSILASNTSSLSITQIGSALKFPERFAGLHFFNPAPVMKLVEIVRSPSTSEGTVRLLRDFCREAGKHPVLATDSPGFIVNRVARLYYVEALKLAEEGVADFASIDKLMRSAGFKMGPFELMDLIGVDTNLAVTKSIYDSFYHESRFRPSRIQQQKVDSGHYGRKSGKGFYEYPKT